MFRANQLKSQGPVVRVILKEVTRSISHRFVTSGKIIPSIFYDWHPYLNRFKKTLDGTAVLSAYLDALIVIEPQEILALEVRNYLFDTVQVNNGRAVYAFKNGPVKYRQQAFHRAAHDVRFAFGMNTHVVAGRIDPGDTVYFDQFDRIAVPDCQFAFMFGRQRGIDILIPQRNTLGNIARYRFNCAE